MRTTPAECSELGRLIAGKLGRALGPVAVYLPLRGVSLLDVPGGPFHDPAADHSLFAALRAGLDQTSTWSRWMSTSTIRRSPRAMANRTARPDERAISGRSAGRDGP